MCRRVAFIAGAMLAGFFIWSDTAASQSVTASEQQLAGTTSKTWIYKRVAEFMGASSGCLGGETYTFSASHELVVAKCTGGKMVDTRYQWSIADDRNGNVDVIIRNLGTYILMFNDTADGRHLMRLRTMGTTQTDPVKDMEFSLEED